MTLQNSGTRFLLKPMFHRPQLFNKSVTEYCSTIRPFSLVKLIMYVGGRGRGGQLPKSTTIPNQFWHNGT